MKAYITRDSVHIVDDTTAPNERRCKFRGDWSWAELVGEVWRASQLPSRIVGGQAAWVLSSGVPLAIAAQQWSEPRILPALDLQRKFLDIVDDQIRLHWSYLGTIDPSVAFDVLQRLRLRAQL